MKLITDDSRKEAGETGEGRQWWGRVDTWKEPRAQRQWTKWRVGTGLGNTNGFLWPAKEEEEVSINVVFQYFYLVARSRVMS